MQRINTFHLNHLRNHGHFQFFAAFRALVEKFGYSALMLQAAWPMFLRLFAALDAALKKIVKSALTEKIREADAARDAAFSSLTKYLAAMCEHYDDDVRGAARKIEVVTHTYGNVAVLPINEETSAVYNLVQELRTDKYSPLVEQIGMTPWVDKLAQANVDFDALIQERDRETAAKNHVAVREERRAIDEAYHHIVALLNARIFFGELTACGEFVDTLNAIIHRYSVMRAHSAGGAGEPEAEEEAEETEEAA